MWKNIGNFLERFANLKPSQNLIKDESAKIIGGLLNMEIKPEDIEERNGVLIFKSANPVLKNEIFLKKEIILKALKQRLGPKSPGDLRF
jgi:hypothetical protein